MKKILILTNHSYMLYRFRLDLILELARENEVVLSMPFVGHEEDFKARGIRCIETDVDRRGINPLTDMKLFRIYRNMLREEKPDMVITYSIKPNIYAGLACRMANIPYCANVQGLGTAFQKKGLSSFVTLLYRTALKRAKIVFFENEGNAEEFKARNIVPDRQKILHGAGVNLKEYAEQPYPKNDKLHFLYLGRIMREKGMDELFYAAEKMYEKYGDKFTLDLVGFFEDEYKERTEQLVRKGVVTFHGFQREPRPYYAMCDCVVLPSYHEGMSNVLLEGAATARPVITTDIHGCKEAVEANVSGYLCEKGNGESLYEAMSKMAELTWDERRAMGIAGRRKTEKEFSRENVVRETVDAIFMK